MTLTRPIRSIWLWTSLIFSSLILNLFTWRTATTPYWIDELDCVYDNLVIKTIARVRVFLPVLAKLAPLIRKRLLPGHPLPARRSHSCRKASGFNNALVHNTSMVFAYIGFESSFQKEKPAGEKKIKKKKEGAVNVARKASVQSRESKQVAVNRSMRTRRSGKASHVE